MKNLLMLIVVLAIAGAGYQWKQNKVAEATPLHIDRPVYAEVRITLDVRDRSVEGVLYAETLSELECGSFAASVIGRLIRQPENKEAAHWKLRKTECKEQLPARHARLFANEPSFVSYTSLSPGNSREREVRIIFWGVTRLESDEICTMIDRKRMEWSGPARCIKAVAQ